MGIYNLMRSPGPAQIYWIDLKMGTQQDTVVYMTRKTLVSTLQEKETGVYMTRKTLVST
jgi:hypothetical protein